MLAASIKTVCTKINEKYQGIDKTSLAPHPEQTTEIPDVKKRLRKTGNEHEGQTEFLLLLGESLILSEFVGAYGLILDIIKLRVTWRCQPLLVAPKIPRAVEEKESSTLQSS